MQILAILFAIIITYLLWTPLEKLSPGGVLLATPPIEEGAKALAAWSFAVPIFSVHLGFGFVEALWEFFRGKRAAGFVAALSHAIFGLAALWAGRWGPVAGFGAALVLHGLWNYFIYRLQLK